MSEAAESEGSVQDGMVLLSREAVCWGVFFLFCCSAWGWAGGWEGEIGKR